MPCLSAPLARETSYKAWSTRIYYSLRLRNTERQILEIISAPELEIRRPFSSSNCHTGAFLTLRRHWYSPDNRFLVTFNASLECMSCLDDAIVTARIIDIVTLQRRRMRTICQLLRCANILGAAGLPQIQRFVSRKHVQHWCEPCIIYVLLPLPLCFLLGLK